MSVVVAVMSVLRQFFDFTVGFDFRRLVVFHGCGTRLFFVQYRYCYNSLSERFTRYSSIMVEIIRRVRR